MKTLDYALWGIAGLAVGAAAVAATKSASQASGPGGHGSPLPKAQGVPFAPGAARPIWPIQSSSNDRHGQVAYRDVNGTRHGNNSRAFLASRQGGARNHVGIDIYANGGDVVVAPETGTIISDQNFLNSIPGEDAMLFQTESGVVLLFGEIVAESFKQFGLDEGSHVKAGTPIAYIATTVNGSHMLHFETYTRVTHYPDGPGVSQVRPRVATPPWLVGSPRGLRRAGWVRRAWRRAPVSTPEGLRACGGGLPRAPGRC